MLKPIIINLTHSLTEADSVNYKLSNMVLGPSKGVLFGPVKDWERPGIKILTIIGGKVRQYQLEKVTS